MASLNLSSDGPAINRSYKAIVDTPLPSGGAASSSTYGQWAIYSVSAPLANAFKADTGKESTLRVQSTGEGELVDLIDDFSDGRIQFAFLKIKDENTALPKFVLIAWCGEGVPERTKGYFGSHLGAVSKLLHGYHVQITARSDRDLSPESIIRKVADASGSKYSGDARSGADEDREPPAPVVSKPAFTPTLVGGSSTGFKTSGARPRAESSTQNENIDEDGWGVDAPRVTRTQLEKVAPAYKPTRVNMAELTSQRSEPSHFGVSRSEQPGNSVGSGYQPVGKVDIAAIRRQAQQSGNAGDDKIAPVKGAYEPVGKVDIAAIRARAQPSSDSASPISQTYSSKTGDSTGAGEDHAPKSLSDRSAAFSQSDRITSLPKPKVANRFGAQASSFTGTKAPTPVGFGSAFKPSPTPVGAVSKNFADQGGKTPAQLWAERKAKAGTSGTSETTRDAAPASPIQNQTSGGGQWQSGYSGKKWGSAQTTRASTSAAADVAEEQTEEQPTEGEEDDEKERKPAGGISALRDRFKNATPMGRGAATGSQSFDTEEDEESPPPLPMASRPNVGGAGRVAMPGFSKSSPAQDEVEEEEEQVPAEETVRIPTPPRQARSVTPPSPPAFRSGSPIRIAMPTARTNATVIEPPEERFAQPAMPLRSLANVVPDEDDLEDDRDQHGVGRAAAIAAAEASLGAQAVAKSNQGSTIGGKRAMVQFDYEKAEDNELELKEGEMVTNIEMVDDDWWMGTNPHGERGLFPSNYVELVEDNEEDEAAAPEAPTPAARGTPAGPAASSSVSKGPSATAEFDYEAAEDNELSFPEGATITSLEFPDSDWWQGTYNGKSGLFPANYVKLDE